MNDILRCGFSHNYPKLYNQTSALLLQATVLSRDSISKEAIEYDTRYIDENGDEHFFPLDSNYYFRLLFMGNLGIPFTTYRDYTIENSHKYCPNIGKTFIIYVKKQEL